MMKRGGSLVFLLVCITLMVYCLVTEGAHHQSPTKKIRDNENAMKVIERCSEEDLECLIKYGRKRRSTTGGKRLVRGGFGNGLSRK